MVSFRFRFGIDLVIKLTNSTRVLVKSGSKRLSLGRCMHIYVDNDILCRKNVISKIKVVSEDPLSKRGRYA